jgi:uncharacterized protein YggU (UPF0235/DUF167 family)
LLRVELSGPVIGLGSPAEKGRANDELIALVADIAGLASSDVSILRGANSRLKVVRIECVRARPEAVAQRILAMTAAS